MPYELPQIDPDLHRRLEADILSRGCIIPVVVTKESPVIDGTNAADNRRQDGFGGTS